MLNWVTLSAEPSTSLSFASTLPVAAVSSGVTTFSPTVRGASFTATTLSVSVALEVTVPSLTV
jgi:hypothetical protein